MLPLREITAMMFSLAYFGKSYEKFSVWFLCLIRIIFTAYGSEEEVELDYNCGAKSSKIVHLLM